MIVLKMPKYHYRELHDDVTNKLTLQYYRDGSGELRYSETFTCYTPEARIKARQDFFDFTDALFQHESASIK